ncbi:hypothetical protein A2U01_0060436, partial [Trifolium medium]|nr:hypothetical protein [Trifolium medium]
MSSLRYPTQGFFKRLAGEKDEHLSIRTCWGK